MKHLESEQERIDVTPSSSTEPPAQAEAIFGKHLPLAVEYHHMLATDGSTRGFIGPREIPRLWQRHILNCAVLAEVMPEDASVADIGSGAGLPGIPLAIARPDLHITLVEPLLKRSTFLGEVKEALGLVNVDVVRGRAEEGPVLRSLKGVDVVTSRAVAPLGKLAGWSLPLLKKGGEMIAMKGSSVQEELERDAKLIQKAGGGKAQIAVIGEQLEEPTTIIRISKIR